MTYQHPMFPPRRRSPSFVPMLPPPVGVLRRYREQLHIDQAIASNDDLGTLMRLREAAAAQIEMLMAFLDDTDGDCDFEIADHDLEDGADVEQCDWRAA